MVAEVVTLRQHTLRDVPAMLRRLADDLEAGQYGEVSDLVAVCLPAGAAPAVFSFGDSDPLASIGLLEIGKAFLTQQVVG